MYIIDRFNKQKEEEEAAAEDTKSQHSEQMEEYRNSFREQQIQSKMPTMSDIKMPQMPSMQNINFNQLMSGFK